jgi:hypothetical protein
MTMASENLRQDPESRQGLDLLLVSRVRSSDRLPWFIATKQGVVGQKSCVFLVRFWWPFGERHGVLFFAPESFVLCHYWSNS